MKYTYWLIIATTLMAVGIFMFGGEAIIKEFPALCYKISVSFWKLLLVSTHLIEHQIIAITIGFFIMISAAYSAHLYANNKTDALCKLSTALFFIATIYTFGCTAVDKDFFWFCDFGKAGIYCIIGLLGISMYGFIIISAVAGLKNAAQGR